MTVTRRYFYLLDDEGDASSGAFSELQDAIDVATYNIRSRRLYDAVIIAQGPSGSFTPVARIEHVRVAENREASQRAAHVVLTVIEPTMVPREIAQAAMLNQMMTTDAESFGVEANVYPQLMTDVDDDTARRFQLVDMDRGSRKDGREDEREEEDAAAKRFSLLELNPVRPAQRPRKNPAICAEDADAAVDKFKEFHRLDPHKLEELDGLKIPTRVRQLGAAKYVLYRSGKVDPATLKKPKAPVNYIHEHDAGVTVYATDGAADTEVPPEFANVTALVRLGKCLGFALRDGSEVDGTAPLPDLACTPDGKCLLVIQDKKKVLAMFWGGALGVFARGIDG